MILVALRTSANAIVLAIAIPIIETVGFLFGMEIEIFYVFVGLPRPVEDVDIVGTHCNALGTPCWNVWNIQINSMSREAFICTKASILISHYEAT